MPQFINRIYCRKFKALINYDIDSRIYLTLANISLIFLSYSIWRVKPVEVNITDFLGLTSHLGLFFWTGLAILTVLSIYIYSYDGAVSKWILIFILVVLAFYLFGLGIFIEDEPRFITSYYPTAEVKNILSSHYIETTSNAPLITYRSWPAFHVISAFMLYIINIDLFSIIKYMPLFWAICTTFISFAIGMRLGFPPNKSFILSFLLLSSFWVTQYYYSPQFFSYILYMILLLFSFSVNQESYRILILLTFFALVIMHVLTPVVIILSYALILIYWKRSNTYYFLIISLAIILISWYIYLAPVAFRYGIFEFMKQIMELNILSSLDAPKFKATSEMKSLINSIRISYLAIYAILGIISLYLIIFCEGASRKKREFKICLFWLVGGASLSLLGYGLEQFERSYIFCLIPVISIILISKISKKIIYILLAITIILHIPAHYGTESFFQTYTSELAGSKFLAYNAEYITLGIADSYILYYNPSLITIMPTVRPIWAGEFFKDRLTRINPLIDSYKTSYMMKYYFGYDPLQSYIDENNYILNLIYNNNGYRVHYNFNDVNFRRATFDGDVS